MPNKKSLAGVWIDKRKAIIVSLENETVKMNTVLSGIDSRQRFDGEKDNSGRFGQQHFDDEKQKENKELQQVKRYLNELVHDIKVHAQVVLFGPANMKHELEKVIKSNREMDDITLSIESADKLTDNQIVAWVKEYYNVNF